MRQELDLAGRTGSAAGTAVTPVARALTPLRPSVSFGRLPSVSLNPPASRSSSGNVLMDLDPSSGGSGLRLTAAAVHDGLADEAVSAGAGLTSSTLKASARSSRRFVLYRSLLTTNCYFFTQTSTDLSVLRFYEILDPSEALAALEDELLLAAAGGATGGGGGGPSGREGSGGGSEGLDALCAMLGELLERECAMHASEALVGVMEF